MNVTMVAMAFGAGLLSFLSPCILPVAPGYLGILSGISLSDINGGSYSRRKILLTTAAFIFGFSVIFIILGAGSSFLGQLFRSNRLWLSRGGGVLIMILGLHHTGLLPIRWLYQERRMGLGHTFGMAGAFLTGFVFALGWTPCVGPVLGSILALAGSQADLGKGIILLSCYALGLGVPFFLLALAFEQISRYMSRIKPYLKYLQWFAGGLLFIMGLLLFTGGFAVLNSFILRWTGGWD